MLSKAFEFYRIVNPKPTSQTIDNRISAVKDALEEIDKAPDWSMLLGYVVGLVGGFSDHFRQDSAVIQSLINAIRTHESAFPEDLSENALELRACAAIVVGEILGHESDSTPDADAMLVASVLRSGIGIAPSPRGRHLQYVFQQLTAGSTQVLAKGSLHRRRRNDQLARHIGAVQEPTDIDTAIKSINELRKALEAVAQQGEVDREESNVLWWLFASSSECTGESLSKMPAGAAVLSCGAELGNLCLLPAMASAEAMVRRAYEDGRKPSELRKKSLQDIAAAWKGHILSLLVADDDARSLAREHPPIFPLSWLCDRLLASQGISNWAEEFEQKTSVSSSQARAPVDWAVQAFRERLAQRLYVVSCQEE